MSRTRSEAGLARLASEHSLPAVLMPPRKSAPLLVRSSPDCGPLWRKIVPGLALGRDVGTMNPGRERGPTVLARAPLAQLAEHLTLNQRVDGSSPSGSISKALL